MPLLDVAWAAGQAWGVWTCADSLWCGCCALAVGPDDPEGPAEAGALAALEEVEGVEGVEEVEEPGEPDHAADDPRQRGRDAERRGVDHGPGLVGCLDTLERRPEGRRHGRRRAGHGQQVAVGLEITHI